MIAGNNVESDAVIKLTETDRAKMDRPVIGLLQMVGAIHTTLIIDTMVQPEDISCSGYYPV